MNHLETLFSQNGWVVTLREKDYLVLDAKGNQCVTTHVRVIDSETIAIGHPLFPDVKMNTRKFKSLPATFRGDLTDELLIANQKVYLNDPGCNYHGPRFNQAFRRDRAQYATAIYNGDNSPHD
jgi:hypothetical protein